jgi:hypothetical protein
MLYDPLDLLSELESSNHRSPTYPRGLPVELLHLVTLLGLGVARVDDIIDVEGGCSPGWSWLVGVTCMQCSIFVYICIEA